MTARETATRRGPLVAGVVALLATQVLLGVSGSALFADADSDPLRPVDAIVVLGGEHDGREAYGIELAESGLAPVVVMSNPYGDDDPVMRRLCRGGLSVEVICEAPEPSTTRGEAMMTRRLADTYGWSSVAVVSWRYHLPRVRYIFSQCFSSEPGSVLATAVPRDYDFSLVHWEYTFLYQYAGFAKAAVQASCS